MEQKRVECLRQCVECERIFDLADEQQAQEWFYGHDCE